MVADGLRRARLATYKKMADQTEGGRRRSVARRTSAPWNRVLAASSKARKNSKK